MTFRTWQAWRSSDNPLHRIVTNAAILGSGKAANAVFSLAYLALTARALGIETMGILILVHSYTQIVGEIVRLRSWEAVLRYGAPALQRGATDDFRTLIRFTARLDLGSALCGAVLAAVGATLAARLLNWPDEYVPAATAYCAVVLFIAPATATGLLRLFNRFDLLAIHSTTVSLTRMVGAALLLLLGGEVPAFLAAWFIASLAGATTLVIFAGRELRRRGLLASGQRMPAGAATFPGLWRFVLTTNLNATVTTVSNHAPTLLVGGLLGTAEAALYRVARELSDALAKPVKLLVPTIFPELARLASASELRPLRDLVRHALRLAALAASVAMLVLWLAGELLLRLVVGEAATPAYGLMLLLGAAALLTLAAFPLEPLLISIGRESAALAARATAAAFHVAILLALASHVGLLGTGIAAICAAVLMIAGQILAVARWRRDWRMSEIGHFSDRSAHDEHGLAPFHRGP